MSDILLQLKKLKEHPKTGAVSVEVHKAAKERLLAVISADLEGGVDEAPSYVSWFFGSFISKPVAAMVSAMVLAVGGLTTVSAAADSLPGDSLYTVKRVTEQAQLKIAKLDRRAVLHTEFAERRLKEASELRQTSTDNPVRLTLAKNAMTEYQLELSQASQDLKQLKGTVETSQTLAAVSNVQQKIESMEKVLDQNSAQNTSAEDGAETLAAKQVANETQQIATTVVVEVHEEEGSELTKTELKEMFRKELGEIEARQTFDEHRLDTIGSILEENKDLFAEIEGMPTADDLKRLSFVIKQTKLLIPEAMNGFALGGYRHAFEILQGIDTELLALEDRVAQIEVQITAALQMPEPVEEGEVIEDDGSDAGGDFSVDPAQSQEVLPE